jgi:sigma-B regulation protein RsbU (phosphoserine phosphatase)
MTTCLEDLRESNEFLNLLLDNINTAVLIADENFQIQEVNRSFTQLFDRAFDGEISGRFGEATGCVQAVMENKPCGETSHCQECVLRKSLISTMTAKVPVDKASLRRVFFIGGAPVEKVLEFSTRPVTFHGRQMVLVFIYDITELESQKVELQKRQTQINEDLAAAAEIQRSLLPMATPRSERVRMAWKFQPSWKIGGDIFNICCLDRERMGLYMLDVCGHGVSAALIAVTVSQFLASHRMFHGDDGGAPLSPGVVLESLNRAFPFERFNSFFSIVYVTIDEQKGQMTYSCAGHPPPLILRREGDLEVLNIRGTVIGADDDSSFEQGQIQLRPRDKLILYTDGILEVFNPEGDIFGKGRFYRALKALCGETPGDLVEQVSLRFMEFARGRALEDDVSLLVLEFKG